MSAIFHKPQGPTRINQVQINQSVLGFPLAVVMGKGKIQQSILWVDGFSSKKIKVSGGKGFGGGKGGTEYVYSADVLAALCNGPIAGIGDVWSGQSWLSNTNAAETYVITAGTPVYTPVNASAFAADAGVSQSTAYSSTHTDLGSSGPVTLSGSDNVPFKRVAYGDPINSGEYSVDPGTGNYHFSASDAGRSVQVNYFFSLGLVKQQEIALVPGTQVIAVGGTSPFSADGGVLYKSGPNEGNALVRVSGTPTATGTYSVTGSAPATYHFAAGDIGAEVLITFKIDNSAAIPGGTPTSLGFTLFEGDKGQSPWSLLLTNYQGAALGYTLAAYVAYGPMDLGFSAQVQQNVFEVFTDDAYGGGIDDCNPVQCIKQILTNEVWGLGAGPVPFPESAIDNGPGGTWGGGTPGTRSTDGTAWSWFAANGFFISPVLDRQDTAASVMSRWLEAGMCAAFISEGLLKLVPYGDTSTAGNGCTWVAPSAFAVALDNTCFLQKSKNQEPVKISTPTDYQAAWNVVQVQWNNRQSQYSPEITPESDQAAINRFGSRIEDPQAWDFITTLPAATFAASMRVKRNVYNRNVYEFSLPWNYSYLEPMDVVTISTASVWDGGNNNPLAIVNRPVRITKIADNPDGTLDITAEDYPFGVHQPTLYNKDIASGITVNKYADPGDAEVVIFEATNRLTGYAGNQIWMGACGKTADWGSCNVLVSMDGTTYKQIGTIETPARLGVLDSTFASGSDPDTVNSLVIDLAENSGALEAGAHADADQDNTLCYVNGELVSYSTMTVSGINQQTASGYIRRGRMGSSIGSHAAGTLFMRLDDAIFKFTYDPSWAGKTIFLKFQSVNVHGNSAQDPASLTAVSFTIPGANPGTIDASTGIVAKTHLETGQQVNSGSFAVSAILSAGEYIRDEEFSGTGSGVLAGDHMSVSAVGDINSNGNWSAVTWSIFCKGNDDYVLRINNPSGGSANLPLQVFSFRFWH